MIVECIMHVMGWDTVWYAAPRTFYQSLKWGERWHVGIWYDDLVILKIVDGEQTDKWLSPGGRTILSALLKSLWKYYTII